MLFVSYYDNKRKQTNDIYLQGGANGTMAICIKTAGAATGYCALHVIEALSDWRVHSPGCTHE